MKKLILGLIIIILLSGCSANYEVNINKSIISENVTIVGNTANENNALNAYVKPLEAYIDTSLNSLTTEKVPGVEYYDMQKSINNEGNNEIKFSYDFPVDKFKDDNIVNLALGNFYVTKANDELSISTSLLVRAFITYEELDNLNIKVNISDDYEIINSNAETKEGNTLYWHVNRENYRTSSMFLRLKEKDNHEDNVDNSNLNNNNNDDKNDKKEKSSIILVSISLLVFLGVLIVIISLKNKIDKYYSKKE